MSKFSIELNKEQDDKLTMIASVFNKNKVDFIRDFCDQIPNITIEEMQKLKNIMIGVFCPGGGINIYYPKVDFVEGRSETISTSDCEYIEVISRMGLETVRNSINYKKKMDL